MCSYSFHHNRGQGGVNIPPNRPKASFWRASFAFLALALLLRVTKGDRWKETLALGGTGMLFSGLLWGTSGLTFSIGIYNSGAAVQLVMLGLAPFFAAIHSYLFYNTKSHPITLVAAVGAIAGIFYMYNSQLDSVGFRNLYYTIWAPLIYGINLSFLRQHTEINRISVSMVGGLIGLLISFGLAKGDIRVTSEQLFPLLILGILTIPFGQTAIGVGTKYIPAGESALISSLETIVGIFYVWLILAEVPSKETLIGAAVVFGCIFTNTLVQAYRAQRKE
ncbi:MAG TPA: DMT family transporter [Sphaerochaeta sp.]|nr:DMT family transporter [Sphaerochaeta sp.]